MKKIFLMLFATAILFAACGAEPELPPEPEYIPAPYTLSFEEGLDGFEPRGNVTITRTNAQSHTGDYSLLVTERTSDWNGATLALPDALPFTEYEFIVWVMPTAASGTVTFQLSMEFNGATDPFWRNFDGANARAEARHGEWTMLRGVYTFPHFETVSVYIETRGAATAEFYLDNVLARPSTTAFAFQDYLPRLFEVYEDYFLIGTAVMPRDMLGTRFELIQHHFNAITAGNHMKPDHLQPTQGNFNFETADMILNTTVDNGMSMIGHTLAWHSQSPPWMNPPGTPREEAIRNLEAHIHEVASRYSGQIAVWDVVNEAFPSSVPPANAADWRANLRQTPWLDTIGYDYIEIAFRAAHAADPYAKLIYNDYNLDSPGKREAVFHMIQELLERGVPIHGVGMQAHYNMNTRPQNVRDSIERFAELGISVSITEFDITVQSSLGNERLTPEEEERQAILYAHLFMIFMENRDVIHRVTFWGIDDATSWRADRFPLLFNYDLSAKLAFYAVLDPEGFLRERGLLN